MTQAALCVPPVLISPGRARTSTGSRPAASRLFNSALGHSRARGAQRWFPSGMKESIRDGGCWETCTVAPTPPGNPTARGGLQGPPTQARGPARPPLPDSPQQLPPLRPSWGAILLFKRKATEYRKTSQPESFQSSLHSDEGTITTRQVS